jgi:hypothetical protein
MGQEKIVDMAKKKQRIKRKDPFGHFKKITVDSFEYLVSEYGFRAVEYSATHSECLVRYRNETTGVTISYEWGGVPSVVVSRLRHTSTGVVEAENIGLRFLLMERCPTRMMITTHFKYGECGDDCIKETIDNYASALKECGPDILTGDFAIFPKLQKLRDAEQVKENIRLYGSESGETV